MKHHIPIITIFLTALIAGGFAVSACASSGTNRSDDRVLMGSSHNVFIGKVVREVGTTPPRGVLKLSSSQYEVDVALNIKGNLKGIVTVSQYEKGYIPLEIGSTYLFAAIYFSEEGYYNVPTREPDYQLLTSDTSMSKGQVVALAENNSRVKALRAVYPNEEIPGYDIRDNRTYNAYASRCLDANGELIDDTVQIANEKKGIAKAQCVTRLTPEAAPTQPPVATPLVTAKPTRSVDPVQPPPPAPVFPSM